MCFSMIVFIFVCFILDDNSTVAGKKTKATKTKESKITKNPIKGTRIHSSKRFIMKK